MNILKKVICVIYNYLSNTKIKISVSLPLNRNNDNLLSEPDSKHREMFETTHILLDKLRNIDKEIEEETENERNKINSKARTNIIKSIYKYLSGKSDYTPKNILKEKEEYLKELGITYHCDLGLINNYFYDIVFMESGEHFEYYKIIKSDKNITNNDRFENLRKEIGIFKREKERRCRYG